MLYEKFRLFRRLLFWDDFEYPEKVKVYYMEFYQCPKIFYSDCYSTGTHRFSNPMSLKLMKRHYRYALLNCLNIRGKIFLTGNFNPKTKLRKINLLF